MSKKIEYIYWLQDTDGRLHGDRAGKPFTKLGNVRYECEWRNNSRRTAYADRQRVEQGLEPLRYRVVRAKVGDLEPLP